RRVVMSAAQDARDRRQKREQPPEPLNKPAAVNYAARRRTVEADTLLEQQLLRELLEEIATIMASADGKMQRIIHLHEAGWAQQQIADEIGIRAETVKKKLAR